VVERVNFLRTRGPIFGRQVTTCASRPPTGKKVSAKELSTLKIERHSFHGDWNYVIKPRNEVQ
jgi:hypothetical protein